MNTMLNAQYDAGLVNNSDLCKLKTTPFVILVMLGKFVPQREFMVFNQEKQFSSFVTTLFMQCMTNVAILCPNQ